MKHQIYAIDPPLCLEKVADELKSKVNDSLDIMSDLLFTFYTLNLNTFWKWYNLEISQKINCESYKIFKTSTHR